MTAFWVRYRKTFVPTQILVVIVCLVGYYRLHANLQTLLAAILFMQIAGFVGAWSTQRMQDKMSAQREQMTINKRRL